LEIYLFIFFIFIFLAGQVTRERETVTSDEARTYVSVSEGGYRQYRDTLQLLARSNKRTKRVTILEVIIYFCQMLGPYHGNYDTHCLLGYDAVSFGRNLQNFTFVFRVER